MTSMIDHWTTKSAFSSLKKNYYIYLYHLRQFDQEHVSVTEGVSLIDIRSIFELIDGYSCFLNKTSIY